MDALKELMLRAPRWKLAVAESVSVGQLQARVGAISGASEFFAGGVTAYTLEHKVRLLHVDRAEAERCACVSAEVARQMAAGVCGLFEADVGVATTGHAEPSAPDGVAVPFAWWAVAARFASGFRIRHGRVECPEAARVEAQTWVAEAAFAELVAFLREARAG